MKWSTFLWLSLGACFLASCTTESSHPVETMSGVEYAMNSGVVMPPLTGWLEAMPKFAGEDRDHFLPIDTAISMPKFQESTLFIKPSVQNANTAIFFLNLGLTPLGWERAPIDFRVVLPQQFSGDLGVGVAFSGTQIPVLMATNLGRWLGGERLPPQDVEAFAGDFTLPVTDNVFHQMFRFHNPEPDRLMEVEYSLFDTYSHSNPPQRVVIDLTEIAPHMGDTPLFDNLIAHITFPAYQYTPPRENITKNDIITALPEKIIAHTLSGTSFELIRTPEKNDTPDTKEYMHKCFDGVEGILWAEWPISATCILKVYDPHWFKRIASLEVVYQPREIQAYARQMSTQWHTVWVKMMPEFRNDIQTREGRKGIFYNPKLPFSLPATPHEDTAVLALDMRSLSGNVDIRRINIDLDTVPNTHHLRLNNASLTLAGNTGDVIQTDVFMRVPQSVHTPLETNTFFYGNTSTKGKGKRMPVYQQEPRYESFFVTQEQGWYHLQQEQPLFAFEYVPVALGLHIPLLWENSLPLRYEFILPKIAGMGDENMYALRVRTPLTPGYEVESVTYTTLSGEEHSLWYWDYMNDDYDAAPDAYFSSNPSSVMVNARESLASTLKSIRVTLKKP